MRECSLWQPRVVRSELAKLAGLGLPVMGTNVLLICLSVIDVMFLGHLGRDALAAAAVGITYYQMVLFFVFGMCTALDTYASQAYGQNDEGAIAYWTVVAFVVMTVLMCPMAVILFFARDAIAVIFSQPAHISAAAGHYCRVLIPALFCNTWFLLLQKNLQAQNVVMPVFWIALCAAVIDAVGNYVFIWELGLGFTGSPVAATTSRFLLLVMMIAYMWWRSYQLKYRTGRHHLPVNEYTRKLRYHYQPVDSGERFQVSPSVKRYQSPFFALNSTVHRNYGSDGMLQTLPTVKEGELFPAEPGDSLPEQPHRQHHPYRKQSFLRSCMMFLSLAIPGGIMTATEEWCFEVSTIIAARFGVVPLGAHTVMMSINNVLYMAIAFGLSNAATIRVGNLVGYGSADRARLSSILTICTGAVLTLFVAAGLLLTKNVLGYTFTNDDKVVEAVASLVNIVATFQLTDCVQTCIQGVLKALGRQTQIAMCSFGAYWLLGLPIGYMLGFHAGLGVAGIWIGFAIGIGMLLVLLVVVYLRIDWELEVEKADEQSLHATELQDSDPDESAPLFELPDRSFHA